MKIQKSLGYLLNLCARLMKRTLDAELIKYDITTTQWGVLKLLSQENHLSQAEIADRANGDRATLGAVIDKLIAKGLVKKELSPKDRRSYIVTILPSATIIVDEVSQLAENVNHLALQGLSQEQMDTFTECLRVILLNLEEKKDHA
ncbi:MAG TPA: MarR family transcriptional regulator [Clostridiales bacterium]|nr:MarR family transcriptional regulator [Clostridiales bacterium]